MFSKILVANRGEIALRVIRACKELGIKSVAVYSEADETSLHLQSADEQKCIGPAISAKSYLNIEGIIQAAKETSAEAIHPGYGYLAESEPFAKACESQGFLFIGPTPQNLQLAGDKITAKKIIQDAGVPVIPSSPGGVGTVEEATRLSTEIGYPVMIKASGGGGGRGMRICQDEEMLHEEFSVARMEARAAFGNDEVYIEKFILEPRHIEFQVLADKFGKIAHLGERECTIQRRYQKLIEESPSPRLTTDLRVTEMVTGIDLIKEQIRLASGEKLGYSFDDLNRKGWAIECRINAEDPDRNFLPSPGIIEEYHPPGGYGIRLDTHLYQGYELPIFYDSLVAKLISYDLTRDGAIRIMKRALEEFSLKPLKTTIPLYIRIMDDPSFQAGEFNTGFINKFVPDEDDDEDDDD
jgi:acetyl-CoA carboxylase biotin carboxylase subunit